MGSAERRERERREVREKMLDAARELFVEEGTEAVTMRRIAQKIDYSPTAIYSHFKDKEELLKDLCERDFFAFAGEFVHLMAVQDPMERLRAGAKVYAEFAIRHPHQFRFLFMTQSRARWSPPADDPRRNDPHHNAYAFLRDGVVAALEAGFFREDLQDGELLTQTLWAAVHGVVTLELNMGDVPWVEWRKLEVRLDAMLDVMLSGAARGALRPAAGKRRVAARRKA